MGFTDPPNPYEVYSANPYPDSEEFDCVCPICGKIADTYIIKDREIVGCEYCMSIKSWEDIEEEDEDLFNEIKRKVRLKK